MLLVLTVTVTGWGGRSNTYIDILNIVIEWKYATITWRRIPCRERSYIAPGGKGGNHLQKSLGIGYDSSHEGNIFAFNFQRKHLVSWPQPSFKFCVLLNAQDMLKQFINRFTNLSRCYNTSTIELMKCWCLRNLSFKFWSGLKTDVTYNM